MASLAQAFPGYKEVPDLTKKCNNVECYNYKHPENTHLFSRLTMYKYCDKCIIPKQEKKERTKKNTINKVVVN